MVMDNKAIQEIEKYAIGNPDVVIANAPLVVLPKLRETLEHARKIFVNTAAAALHIEVATHLEERPSDGGVLPDQYIGELESRWSSIATKLNQARSYDNQLYEALRAENWRSAHESSQKLATLAENVVFEVVAPVHLSIVARRYFRENGTPDNIRLAAEYELRFTRALDRFIYWYQKGL